MIQTQFGPVGLRRPRDFVDIGLHGGGGGRVKIEKEWLKAKAKKNLEEYRLCVKQAMLIAATTMELESVTNNPQALRSETGAQMTSQKIREKQASLRQKKQAMQDGSVPVPMKRLAKGEHIVAQAAAGKRLDKHLLVKRSHKCGLTRSRFFNINNGRLNVYKQNRPNLKAKNVFDLKEVICRYENKKTPGLTEPFVAGFEDRIFIQCRERPHGPMYLYARDPKEAKSWQRAIIMSKYLLVPSDREALAVVVGRVVGNIGKKGWDALSAYAKEIKETKNLVRTLAMRLTRLELSRGWNKVRLVYKQQEADEKLRVEQQEWAARFLKEKMDRINQQAARSPAVVRRTIISQIQSKFRHFREERIFDRMYPLGSNVQTRMQQAMGGQATQACFQSLNSKEALQIMLKGGGLELLESFGGPEFLQSRKSSYSEVNINTGKSSVSVSDSLTMLSFSGMDESEHSNLAKAGWAHFVNLDQISSVILHSQMSGSASTHTPEDKPGKVQVNESTRSGTWFTINGPRVSWCRSLQKYSDTATGQEATQVVGATDGMALGRALARGEKIRFFRLAVAIKNATVPRAADAESHLTETCPGCGLLYTGAEANDVVCRKCGTQRPPLETAKPRQSYLLLNFLGRQFSTKNDKQVGDNPQFRCQFEAEVPISADEMALAVLDEHELGIEVVEYDEEPSLCKTSWVGNILLWKLFLPADHPSLREVADHALKKAQDTLHSVGIGAPQKEQIHSIAQTLSNGNGQVMKTLPLVDTSGTGRRIFSRGTVDIEVTARVREAAEPTKTCISPELQGRGPITSLFSTHRGAWYDPNLGTTKFQADHVANFAEFRLDGLVFPPSHPDDGSKIYRYHIEAKSNGITVASLALHRPRPQWKDYITVDAGRIDYGGYKIFVPMLPGCWCDAEPPAIEIVVMRCPEIEAPTFTFRNLLDARGKPGIPGPSYERVYHGIVTFDGGIKELLIDQTRGNVSVPLSKSSERPTVTGLGSGNTTASGQPATLVFGVTLRDRDYVRLNKAMPDQTLGWKADAIVCIGDKAMLRIEEPLSYPANELEYRHKFLPGVFGEGTVKPGNAWNAPLRDPSMSHEWAESGLDRLPQPPNFKQKYIPTHCDDVIPSKFVLPQSETQFMQECRPGVFWRIIENIVANPVAPTEADQAKKADGKPAPVVVNKLSHRVRNMPVTVLAVYANPNGPATCDLEVSPVFMHDWERHPDKSFAVPGSVVIKEFQDMSLAYMRAAPTGTGDVGERQRRRVVLKEVPITHLQSVQTAGFNVYDAAYGSVDEAIKVHPSESRNDFNPRDTADDSLYNSNQSARRGGYSISAGPVPADAGPTCQYEWSLHLHAPTEDDMYHFATMIRQSVRMDLAQQVKKMKEYRKKTATKATMSYHTGTTLTGAAGTLEVVLVEARHLKPTRFQGDTDMSQSVKRSVVPEFSPCVTFAMSNDPSAAFLEEIKAGGTEFKVTSIQGFVVGRPIVLNPGAANTEEVNVVAFAGLLPANDQYPNQGRVTIAEPLVNDHKKSEALTQMKEALVYRGSKLQSSPAVQATANPNWSQLKELQSSGGWIFKSPNIEPSEMKNLAFELNVLHKGMGAIDWPIGTVRVPVKGGKGDAGVPSLNLCDMKEPFKNLWLPLYEKDEKGKRLPRASGEIHILTLWCPKQQTAATKRLPKTARAFMAYELRPKQLAANVREPVYDLSINMLGYNPNTTKGVDAFPPSTADVMSRKTEKVFTNAPYLECRERQQQAMWASWFVKVDVAEAMEGSLEEEDTVKMASAAKNWPAAFFTPTPGRAGDKVSTYMPIVDIRRGGPQIPGNFDRSIVGEDDRDAKSKATSCYEVTDLLRRGIPAGWRKDFWMDITNAKRVKDSIKKNGNGTPQEKDRDAYLALVATGRPYKTEAMNQLNEDLVGAAAWEQTQSPPLRDMHQQRLKRAQDVCIALITFTAAGDDPGVIKSKSDQNTNDNGDKATPLAYCESLLVLAFFLLLPQSGLDKAGKKESEEEKCDAEVRAFWIIYTLAASPANQVLREYFGAPPGFPRSTLGGVPDPNNPAEPLCERSGAMEDVFHLDKIIARWECDLWVHLRSLGFQLHDIFYGAFMRLFAFMLPTASLFRFWDHFFSESSAPVAGTGILGTSYKPRRHALIDFAYAILKSCKEALLQSESALEARDVILSYIENLHDPDEVVRMTCDSERALWVGVGKWQERSGLLLHGIDFNRGLTNFDTYLQQFRTQNAVMATLIRDCVMNNQSAAADDKRLTTKNVVNFVIPTLQNLLMGEGVVRNKKGGMFRQATAKILEDCPDAESSNSVVSTAWSMATAGWEKLTHVEPQNFKALAHGVPPPPGTAGEPERLDRQTFTQAVMRGQIGTWMHNPIFDAFESREEQGRISLNELFSALICCSKGTVGDKALALFQLYSSNQAAPAMNHVKPTTHYSHAVVEKVEGNQAQGMFFQAPMPEEVSAKTALHFKVYVAGSRAMDAMNANQNAQAANNSGASVEHGMLLGEAFVPTMKPYVFSGMAGGQVNQQKFSIWAPQVRLPPGAAQGADGPAGGIRYFIGEITMSIKWIPSPDRPDVGQLGVHVYDIAFEPERVEAAHKKNPRIVVCTYDENRVEKKIPRWDPRSGVRKVASTATLSISQYGGAFGGTMGWEETQWKDPFGVLHHKQAAGAEQGWDSRDYKWKWSDKWGDQYSVEDFAFRKEFCEVKQRANAISMQACRLITTSILQRGLCMLTNRQSALYSDAVFNRAGAVPAILEAILVKGELTNIASTYNSIAELKADASFREWRDVKHHLYLNAEYLFVATLGNVNLFGPHPTTGENVVKLNTMKPQPIKDYNHWYGSKKVLWIRYARSGDGERGQRQIEVDVDGNLMGSLEIPLDMALDSKAGGQQMLVTKEEFISCVLACPLLSETLRQLSTGDASLVSKEPRNYKDLKGQPIKLDVTIADPTRHEADQEILDTMNVGQAILVELWDFDRFSRHDFLGECWLPPLATVPPHPKKFVLPIKGAGLSEGGTRPETKKMYTPTECKGDLYVELAWNFPLKKQDEVKAETTLSLEERVKLEDQLHSGELTFKIEKAKNLRYADVRRAKGSDPYCICYIKNETYPGEKDGWRSSPVTGMHQEIFRTNWRKATINPEFNEETKVMIQTGAYEKRTKQKLSPAFTARQKQRNLDDRALKVIKDAEELKVYFGDPKKISEGLEGARHRIDVYLGETIHQFKVKLQTACAREAAKCVEGLEKLNRKSSDDWKKLEDSRMQFQSIADSMSFRHAIMVFVPSVKLRELAQQNRTTAHEYKRLFRVEDQDPSNWQPLDPIRTFTHYQSTYGFGMELPQRLRICEGSDDYKLRNHRYRQFEDTQKKWNETLSLMNTTKQCFGYVRYTHVNDGNSTEWRAAILQKPEDGAVDKGGRTYKSSYCFAIPPRRADDTTKSTGAEGLKDDIKEKDVLLAPMLPAIMGSSCLQHQEFLKLSIDMHDAGKNDADITKELNVQMTQKYGSMVKRSAEPPPVITVQEVQHYLRVFSAGLTDPAAMEVVMETPGALPAAAASSMATPTATTGGPGGGIIGPGGGGGGGPGSGLMAGPGPGSGPRGGGSGGGLMAGGGPGGGGGQAGPSLVAGPGGQRPAGPAMMGGPGMAPRPGGAGPSMGPGVGGSRPGGPGGGGVSMGPSSMN
jgi:hypothetical protein